jgi:hypothetical protein
MNTFTLDGKLADTRVNSIHILVGLSIGFWWSESVFPL